MDAKGHLAAAEELLMSASVADGPDAEGWRAYAVQAAQGHALIAAAIEAGAPHSTDSTGASSGQ